MKYLIILIFLQLNTSCEKVEQPKVIPCIGDYNLYSTDSFDYVKTHLINNSLIMFESEFEEKYLYSEPVFNPKNPYEFAYLRMVDLNFEQELWKFSFCTGYAVKIADNAYYNLDWSSNGWLSYTGTGHQIFIVKENGDSLTQITTTSGYNRAGKWNSNGTYLLNNRDDGDNLINKNGEIIKTISPSGAIDWINDSLLLVSANLFFNSYNINSHTFSLLNSNKSQPYSYFNKKTLDCYTPTSLGIGFDDFFIKYSINGSNEVDTICKMYDSYHYTRCDFSNDKIITALSRQHWSDTIYNKQIIRRNIMIMDKDGSNQRLVNLP